MAIGRLEVRTGAKGKATAHSDYIARTGKYEGYDKGEKMEGKGYGNMPSWAEKDPSYFWQMADEKERKNGTSYREHIITLPRELDPSQRGELVQEWIKNEVGEGQAYQYAIHNKTGMDGKEQPHVHLMINEREQDGIQRDPDQYFKRYNAKNPDRGGCKKANTGKNHTERKEELKSMRERWEKLCNQHLERAGLEERIDMSNKGRAERNIPYEKMKRPEIEQAYRESLKQHHATVATVKDFTADYDIIAELEKAREQARQEVEQDKALPRPQQSEKSDSTAANASSSDTTTNTPTAQEIEQAHDDIATYKALLQRTEQAMASHASKGLREQLQSKETAYNTTKKPMLMSQNKWATKQLEDRKEMQTLRRQISTVESKGYREQAEQYLRSKAPEVAESYDKGKQTVWESQRGEREEQARQRTEQLERAKQQDNGIDR